MALAFVLAACTQNNDAGPQEKGNNQPQGVTVKNSQTRENKNLSDEQRADHLAKLAAGVPNVENAQAVVLGDFVIIGIDVDQNLDRSKVGTIKYSVAESLKHDPQADGAIVVADPDINARLSEIRQDMNDGRPIQGILNELSDIAGRIMPEAPQQNQGGNPDRATEKQKNEMNSNSGRQLEQRQENQSYQQK